jgi:hypothetical protein
MYSSCVKTCRMSSVAAYLVFSQLIWTPGNYNDVVSTLIKLSTANGSELRIAPEVTNYLEKLESRKTEGFCKNGLILSP